MLDWKISLIEGSSMAPTLKHGDYVISKKPNHNISVGNIVIIKHPKFGKIIKRISSLNNSGQFIVEGDNPESTSPELLGPIDISHIKEIVCWRVEAYHLSRIL
ncbi:MAG: hypothetical protein CMM53_11995 [Rhodospirillaceae bacterium]|nr:hypothetical protein [Rhodospirillaceae bacterium]|tara:strand:+ start:3302 stop:3610 length:309 start_codon:yes stop_codon:yes gene_type:complete